MRCKSSTDFAPAEAMNFSVVAVASLGLSGRETFEIAGLAGGLRPRMKVTVTARGEDGREARFRTVARLDGEIDVTYLRNGGVLQTVLRRLAAD